jgi:hypothetical protein
MEPVRPLRELLTDLVGDADARAVDPAAYLAEHGHPGLPADLVAEAVVNFADTASPAVAEQLAPFVTAHTAGEEPAEDWFDLLTSAPVDPGDDLDDLPDVLESSDDFGPDPDLSLDFGAGADSLDFPDSHTPDLDTTPDHTDWSTPSDPEPPEAPQDDLPEEPLAAPAEVDDGDDDDPDDDALD